MKHTAIIEVPIDIKWIDEARLISAEMGTLKHSFMKGTRNLPGVIGELLVNSYLGDCVKRANIDRSNPNYHFDLVAANGLTIDVKTKQCGTWSSNAVPKPYYECSVPAYQVEKQNCDYYVFVRVHQNLNVGWICGAKSKADFVKEATLCAPGDIRGSNLLCIKNKSYQLEISKLDTIHDLKAKITSVTSEIVS